MSRDQDDARPLHLHGVVLPDGARRDVFVVDGRITFEPVEDALAVLNGGYLIPGLVDAHAHLAIASPAPPEASAEESARASARAQLAAGVLVVREPGGPNRLSAGIGPLEGLPRTFTGGRFLAPPGGYVPGLAREVSEAELPEAAEEEARSSGAWAKVVGDWMGPDGTMNPNFRTEALAEAARRVHLAGARIAMHATSPAAIESAIEAGFDSIEHAVGLQDDHLVAMAERGIALVPTLTILPHIVPFMSSLGASARTLQTIGAGIERHPEMTRRAVEAGLVVLAGTDAGMGPHGMIRGEIGLLQDAGVPQETALAAGSWEARRFLGLPGIEEGAPADLVAYADDPRGDPSVLARPLLRILDGRLIPATATPPA